MNLFIPILFVSLFFPFHSGQWLYNGEVTLLGLCGVLLKNQQGTQLLMRCYGCAFVWLCAIVELSPFCWRLIIIKMWHFCNCFVSRQGLQEQIVLGIGGKGFVPIRILRLLIGRLPASLQVVNQCFKMDVKKKKKKKTDMIS